MYDNVTAQPVNTPKAYGKSIKASDLPEGIAKFFPVSSPTATSGLTAPVLLPIIQAIREDIAEIKEVFAGIDMRMVGGSLLIIYEGDIEKAKAGVAWMDTVEDDDEEAGEDNEEESDDEESKAIRPGPPYVVKLIDFAHTRITPGEGPDEGVLKGLQTVLTLLDERIAAVREALSS